MSSTKAKSTDLPGRFIHLISEWLDQIAAHIEEIDGATRGDRGPERTSVRVILGGYVYLMMTRRPPQVPRLYEVLQFEANGSDLRILGIDHPLSEVTLQRVSSALFRYLEGTEDDELARLQPFFDTVIPPSAGTIPDRASRAVDSTLFEAYTKRRKRGEEHLGSDPDARWRTHGQSGDDTAGGSQKAA